MNRRQRLAVFLVALWIIPASRPAAAEPHKDRCVILVSIDGLANFYIDDPKADVPTMRKLAARGARAEGGMICAFPTAI